MVPCFFYGFMAVYWFIEAGIDSIVGFARVWSVFLFGVFHGIMEGHYLGEEILEGVFDVFVGLIR